MNRLFFLLVSLLYTTLSAQIILNPHNTGFLPVSSYNGATTNNLIHIQFHLDRSNGNQVNFWSLTYRVTGTITNGINNFPPERLKFSFNSIEASPPYPVHNVPPTAQNMGLNTGTLPFSLANSYFVQNSPYSLETNGQSSFILKYNVSAEGGAYLEQYRSWNNYRVNLIIELFNRKNERITWQPVSFDMQVHPNDSPPQTPTYGIQFDASAKNVLLEFKTAGDYANGVSKTLTKAFSTFSNTPYVVRVNTLNSNLTSSSNHTLPVNAVKLSVKDNQSGAVTGSVNLSGSQQNILTSSAHTATKFFDTTYTTQAGDNTFFNKSYEQYSGTVVFTMIPQ